VSIFKGLQEWNPCSKSDNFSYHSQLYFFHNFDASGYEVFLHRSDTVVASPPVVVARCSLAGSNPGATADDGARSEASCYTSAVVPLSRGDSVYLRVRELSRHLNLARGHSFFGMVKLGKKPGGKIGKNGNKRGILNDPQCPVF
jgi:hypothetical protein